MLGSILLNDAVYLQVAGVLSPEDFSLEKHRRIYGRMRDLYDRGGRIDRVTLAEELMKQGQLESVDGMSYLVSLDDRPAWRSPTSTATFASSATKPCCASLSSARSGLSTAA